MLQKIKFIQQFFTPRKLLLLLGLIYLSLQIPFIKADPDKNISFSRGANTDEGLHASQIRNFINHGELNLSESDNFVKTPLFGAYLYLPILTMGSSLSVVRWAMVFPFLILLMWIAWRNTYFVKVLLALIPLVLLEYHTFNFSHFSLAEMPSTIFIFCGILTLAKPIEKNQIYKRSILIAILFAVPIFFKIQFLYIAPLLPALFLIYFFKIKTLKDTFVKVLLWSSIFLFGLLILFYLIWYLPNQEIFDFIMADQTSGRWARYFDLPNHLKWVNKHILLENKIRPVTIIFYFLFPLGVVLSFWKKSNLLFRKVFLGLSIWFLLETHKMGMMYLPTRYFVSFFFCMAAINTLVIFEFARLCFSQKKYKKWAMIPIAVFVIILLHNSIRYIETYERRTFSIRKINQYLEPFEFGDRPIIGAWAPSLTWKTKARTYPVWNNYFNHQHILTQQKPAIIISEMDESDSGKTYISQGINIDEHADSIRYFQIHDFKLKILWMGDDE